MVRIGLIQVTVGCDPLDVNARPLSHSLNEAATDGTMEVRPVLDQVPVARAQICTFFRDIQSNTRI